MSGLSELTERLKAIVLGESVLVPARFDVSCLEKLSEIYVSGIITEARRVNKLLLAMSNAQVTATAAGCGPAPISVHAQLEQIANAVMGVVNPYWLCRINAADMELSPVDILKMLATLGTIESGIGQPVVSVTVAVALAPKPVVPYYPSYYAEWLGRKMADSMFIMDKKAKAKGKALKLAILKLMDDFIAFKYEHKELACGETPTPETHPIKDVDVATWYEEHKPEGA
jgi:hypothetical protein